MSLIILLTVIYSFGFRDSVSAASADYSTTLTSGQTWARPQAVYSDNGPHWFTEVSNGLGVYGYVATSITVDVTGSYSITTNSGWDGFDSMLYVYSGDFDPNNPLSNFIIGDDDGSAIIDMGGYIPAVDLTAGNVYNIITTSFHPNAYETVGFRVDGLNTLDYSASAGGSISGSDSQVIISGTSGTEVTAVADANYHFVDWSDGALAAARTDLNVTANVAVSANFAIDSHNVSFDSKGGSMVADIPADYNTAILVPAVPTMTGYTFDYWYYVADGTETQWNFDTDTVTDNVTLSAHWTINSYTVIFQDWNGTVISQVTVDYGSDAAAPAIPVRTGYTFTSWSLPFTAVTGDITTIAGYSLNPTPAPTSTPTLAPTPLTVVLGTNITATPTAAPTTGILGAAKTGETANHMTVLIGCVLLASFGAVGSVFVIRRKRTQD